MKILFITHQNPWPCDSGQKLRNYFNLKHLSTEHEVDLISTDKEPPGSINLPLNKQISLRYKEPHKILSLYAQVIKKTSFFEYRFKNTELYEYISLNHQKYDIIWFAGLQHMINLPRDLILKPKIILDNHNVENSLYQEYSESKSNPIEKILLKNEANLLKGYEEYSWKKSDINFACSKEDTAAICEFNTQSFQLPNCMEDSKEPRYNPQSESFKLIYCGTMNWLPNIDAMEYFMKSIWPHICNIPKIEFNLIGGGLPSPLQSLFDQYPNAHYHGYVKDIDPLYEAASLSVVPLRMGSGTRLKILEAASWALPTVSTQVGASGLECFYGQGVYKAEDEESFIKSIKDLYANRAQLKKDSELISSYFKRNFSTISNGERIDQILKDVA